MAIVKERGEIVKERRPEGGNRGPESGNRSRRLTSWSVEPSQSQGGWGPGQDQLPHFRVFGHSPQGCGLERRRQAAGLCSFACSDFSQSNMEACFEA
jgi:hypothetical protein